MVELQDGRCPICQQHLADTLNFAIDHNHDTLALRDLLCRKCNTILGFADDSIERLQRAIDYLIKHRDQPRDFKIKTPKDYRAIAAAKNNGE